MKKILLGVGIGICSLGIISSISVDNIDYVSRITIKQQAFVCTKDYSKALRLLRKGYILQDVDVFYVPNQNQPYVTLGKDIKYYTLIKY